MSGLEVAGIVLAVIPLFILAIEHYEDGLGPVKMLRLSVYRRQLAHYRTKLVLEYGLYTNALEELLVDIVPRQDLRNMITQGSGPLWKDPMLDNRLKERLGMIYDTYLIVMRQMQEVMVKIACLLDIARQDNVSERCITLRAFQLTGYIDGRIPARTPPDYNPIPIYRYPRHVTIFRSRSQKEAEVWSEKRTNTTSARRARSLQ